ncbi:MAG: MATE family efflux transporter [Angelakisella sp.]
MEYNLTTGKIGKSLIVFSLPMILGNIIQQLYNVADTLIVGKGIGPTALAAVGSSYALMVLLTSIVLGLCMGSGVVFAQLYGAKQHEDMKISIFNSFVFIILVSTVINILSYILLDKFILWLNIPIEAAGLTREYLNIIFAGMIFVAIYNFIASILRSIGNTVMPLVFLAVAAFTNIVLDILFVIRFHMGVEGAAIATVISQALSAVCITVYFFMKAKFLCPSRSHLHYNKRLLRTVINNSTLTAIQQSIMNLGILMVQGLVNSFGFAASAAFAVVVKIDAFAYMPAQDFGNAFSTYVAQNYGAKKTARIRTGALVATKISMIFCLTASAVVCIFAKPFMLLFVDAKEVEIINIGIQYLNIVGACYVGIGILFLLYGLYRGLGKASISIVLTVISLGSRVVLAYVLSAVPSIGMPGIWWAVPIGWALADIYGIWYFCVKKPIA